LTNRETLFPVLILLALLAHILLEKYGTDNKIIFDPRVIWPALKSDRGRRRAGDHLKRAAMPS